LRKIRDFFVFIFSTSMVIFFSFFENITSPSHVYYIILQETLVNSKVNSIH